MDDLVLRVLKPQPQTIFIQLKHANATGAAPAVTTLVNTLKPKATDHLIQLKHANATGAAPAVTTQVNTLKPKATDHLIQLKHANATGAAPAVTTLVNTLKPKATDDRHLIQALHLYWYSAFGDNTYVNALDLKALIFILLKHTNST
ncbi:hypothetical protein R5R35_000778 [Gryllus longicercus]|uniref:Uncharacterized protein n=1 Tax=Gryllus longicercus TaxID=2509291 RepID=A0AAN9Z3G7_9ORTH